MKRNKNILLVNPLGEKIEQIISNTEWYIAVLIVEQENIKSKYIGNERIGKIYTYIDILSYNDVSQLNMSETQEYLSIYHNVEYGMLRYGYTMPEVKYKFYMGISFLERLFSCNNFDMSVVGCLEHGRIDDVLLMAASKKYNVPVYEFCDINADMMVISYKTKNTEYLLPLKEYEHISNLQDTAVYYQRPLKIASQEGIKQKIGNKVYEKIGAWGARMLQAISRRTLRMYQFNSYDFSIIEYNLAHLNWYLLKKYISTKYVNYDAKRKYVIYFLHFEPEAVISNYANQMDSQLIIIKMLSESLPQGWILYVKEHPDMYKMNTYQFDYYIIYSRRFFNRYFVDKILELSNVKLIDYRIKSNQLIRNAQGVATVCGTVILEAVQYHKPLLLFANENRVMYKYVDEIFMVNNFNDCKNAMNEIIEGYEPTYHNFEKIMSEYCFYISRNSSWKNALQTIEEHFLRQLD